MPHKKRKATKRKSGKSRKKKKHLNLSVFFIIALCVLLAAIIYYFYQHEQGKRKTAAAPHQKEAPAPAGPTEKSKPKALEKKSNKKSGSTSKPVPAIPRIIDYTDLEYPVSYSSQPEQIIFHTGHTVSYNKNWKIPNWVSYELTIDETMGEEKRYDKFMPDPFIKEGIVTTADYRNSGYDRGHMAPAADLKWSDAGMKESFYLSNICPQHPKLNQRRWKELENKVREWAIADSAIIVICGPIVKNTPKHIGINKIVVPYGFFKVILSPFKESPKAIGFIFDNTHCTEPLRSHIVSVDSVETITGLDFFSSLPDEIENLLEAHIDTLYWL